MSTAEALAAIADRLTAAIAAADADAMAAIYAADAVIWHATDQIELTVGQLQDVVRAIGSVSTAEVAVTGLHPTPEGFVQTQVNTYTLKDGATTSFHAALVVTLGADGRITRLDEYLDSAGLAPLIAALGAG